MAKEKNVDAEKLPQDNRDNERLTESELDGVASGSGEKKVPLPSSDQEHVIIIASGPTGKK